MYTQQVLSKLRLTQIIGGVEVFRFHVVHAQVQKVACGLRESTKKINMR